MSLGRCLRTSMAFSGGLVGAQFGKQEFTKYQHGNASYNGIRMKITPLKMPTLALPKLFAQTDKVRRIGIPPDREAEEEEDEYYDTGDAPDNTNSSDDDVFIDAINDLSRDEKTSGAALIGLQGDIGITLPNLGTRCDDTDEFIIIYDQARKSPLVTYEYLTLKNLNSQTLTPDALRVIGSGACSCVNATLPIIPNIGSYAKLHMKKMVATENHPEHQVDTLHIINEAIMHDDAIPSWNELENKVKKAIKGDRTKAVHVFSGPMFTDHIIPASLKKIPDGHQIPNAFFKVIISELMCPGGASSYHMEVYSVRSHMLRKIKLAELDSYTRFGWSDTVKKDIVDGDI